MISKIYFIIQKYFEKIIIFTSMICLFIFCALSINNVKNINYTHNIHYMLQNDVKDAHTKNEILKFFLKNSDYISEPYVLKNLRIVEEINLYNQMEKLPSDKEKMAFFMKHYMQKLHPFKSFSFDGFVNIPSAGDINKLYLLIKKIPIVD